MMCSTCTASPLRLEADLVAHRRADLLPALLRHARGDGDGADAPRLRAYDVRVRPVEAGADYAIHVV